MKVLETEQGSTEWLALRSNKITGTDSAIICGISPYKTKMQLWEQKLQIAPPDECTPIMKRGSELEYPARLLLQESLGMEFTSIVAISLDYPYLMASLDGISDCKRFMCEIKSPGLKNHELAIQGIISEIYIYQIQHCLIVTKCEKCYFCSYFPGHEREIVIIEVFPNLEKQKEIIEKGYEFYQQMCRLQPPEEWKLNQRNK